MYVFDKKDNYLATISSDKFSNHLKDIVFKTQKNLGELNILKSHDTVLLFAKKQIEADFITNNFLIEWKKIPTIRVWTNKQGENDETFAWSWFYVKEIADKKELLSKTSFLELYDLLSKEINTFNWKQNKFSKIREMIGTLICRHEEIANKRDDIEEFSKILAVKMGNIDVWIEKELIQFIAWAILHINSKNLFLDKNRIMTRLIVNYILKYFKKTIIVFRPFAEQHKYNTWLKKYKSNNSPVYMENFVFDMRKKSIEWVETYIKEFRWKIV